MVNVEYAVKHSLNTVAVKILRQLGNERSYDFLKNGLMINSLDKANDTGDASLALGQHSRGITLRELVAAYSIFSDGIMKKSRTYYKVTDNRGMIILDNQPSEVRVISEENAAIMTKLLQEVINDGTASSLIDFEDLTEAAGKTGTTQHTYDKYFVGFTPTVLAGVWQGFEMPESLDFIGYNYSAVVWNEIIGNICRDHHRYTRQTKFKVPQCVKKLSYNKVTGGINGDIGMNESFDEGWFDIKSLNN
jgi:membrane peptidoglycan carboxypeptidase